MSSVEKRLKIFLASPSDVPRERTYLVEEIDRINRTVASSKNITLQVIRSEKDVFPGYGEDGQTVLNAQIAKMEDYALFIGIMWNRLGTQTPRADSGTVEEFKRAVKSLTKNGTPQIWFYFRESAAHLKTEEELEQRRKVLAFKKTLQEKALIREYASPAKFRDLLHDNILLWLNSINSEISKPETCTSKTKKVPAASQGSTTVSISGKSTTATSKKKKLSSTQKSTPPTLKSSQKKRLPISSRSAQSISNSGAWVLLNDQFFLTESVNTESDQSVILQILSADLLQEAALRHLQPEKNYHKKQISYAYQNEASLMQVESVLPKSVKGKTTFVLTLKPFQQAQGNSFMDMTTFSGYSPEKIAELRARLLLLNETPPTSQNNYELSMLNSYIKGHDSVIKAENCIFIELWTKLKSKPQNFLKNARLLAVYYLKMTHTVEHILELKLTLLKNNTLSVHFCGQRKQIYSNQEPAIIEIKGNCTL